MRKLVEFINEDAAAMLQHCKEFSSPEAEAAFWKGTVYKYLLMTCAALKAEPLESTQLHGCTTGDCPHENAQECVKSLVQFTGDLQENLVVLYEALKQVEHPPECLHNSNGPYKPQRCDCGKSASS